MAMFPLLSTGAVMQYGSAKASDYLTEVIPFLDGQDQRCPVQGPSLRRWQIRLDLLSEEELASLETFFAARQGSFGSFDFPDPFSGTTIPNCRFDQDTFIGEQQDVNMARTVLNVVETHG